jgi:hypothetical protein
MEWFRQRLEVAHSAYRHRRVLITIAVAICVFIGLFDDITQLAKDTVRSLIAVPIQPHPKEGVAMIFGIPSWIVGVILLLTVVVVIVFEYAVSLHKKLKPDFDIDFDSTGIGIVKVPIEIRGIDRYGQLSVTNSEGVYIRITLTAKTSAIVKNIIAFLVKIEKKKIPTAPFSQIFMGGIYHQLPGTPLDIPPRVPRTVDF